MAAFPEVSKVKYEGPDSKNPLAFRWYNEDEVVEGKTMKDHFRFSVVYWHTFRGTGADPFGAGTMVRPWDDGSETVGLDLNRHLGCQPPHFAHVASQAKRKQRCLSSDQVFVMCHFVDRATYTLLSTWACVKKEGSCKRDIFVFNISGHQVEFFESVFC